MIDEPAPIASDWLWRTYGGLVAVAGDEPLLETEQTWLVPCAYADSDDTLLTTTLAVPKDGAEPFPVANADPLGDSRNTADGWAWRVNARGCLVATDAAVDNRPSSALPWRPADEAPGWWDRLLTRHFPGAEVTTCASWAEVTAALGPGTRGVVWLRRRVFDTEITGHLLYAYHAGGDVVFVDGQRGTPALLDDNEVGGLVLARFHRAEPSGADPLMPTLAPAPDLAAAVAKANSWLAGAYGDAVALVDPSAADETARGWLFACTTKRFQVTGDWRDQLLDAALVVPKDAGVEPFGLPNDDPWTWLRAWDAGQDGLPEPPEPGDAAWFEPAARQLGTVRSTRTHRRWGDALAELADLPLGAKALVWLRRRDSRGRETVGNLLVAVKERDEVRLVDARALEPTIEPDPLALHVISFG